MIRFLRHERYQRQLKNLAACCLTIRKGKIDKRGRKRVSGLCAELHFHRARFDTDIVAHEATHAAVAWARRRNIAMAKLSTDDGKRVSVEEERFATAAGFLIGQIACHAHRLSLWSCA
jgi:hypothetical protein